MSCEVVVDEGARIVRAHYRGEVSLQERLSTAFQMLVAAERTGITRYLCDFRNAQASNVRGLDASRVIEQYISRLPSGSRMAYVLRFDHQLDDSIESLMRAHGMSVERFNELALAEVWLRDPDDALALAQPSAGAPVAALMDRADDLKRTMRLVAEAVDLEQRVSPDQFAAVGELVHDLLAKGVDEATVRDLARRVAAAMRG